MTIAEAPAETHDDVVEPVRPTTVPRARQRRRPSTATLTAALLVGLTVAFNLWVLHAELTSVHNLNDSSVHYAYTRWAHHRISTGHVPLDGWFPNLSLGYPVFHYYQSLPHVLTGYLSTVFGADASFHWTLLLLVSFWPVCVYCSARLFGFGRWAAVAAAVISPLLNSVPGYGYEHGSYTWQGLGVWSQLWAMWLLPLALATTWRAVDQKKSYALAALLLGLTTVCHFLTAYLAILAIGLWVVVRPSQLLARAVRGAAVLGGALAVGAFLLLPFFVDGTWAIQTEFNRGTIFNDSYGASKILHWLVNGGLFDHGRYPIVTVLFFVGVVVSLVRARHDALSRALLAFWVMCLVLFFGRPTWGRALKVLPGSDDLLFHRFISGVHMGAILLAGIGAAWLGTSAVALARRRLPRLRAVAVAGAAVVVLVALLLPAFSERRRYDHLGTELISAQQRTEASPDAADLQGVIDDVRALGGGRVYAGLLGNWGRSYRVGEVPVCEWLLTEDIDTVGFSLRTLSLSSDVEARFDETNPFNYQVFNVAYLILPADRSPGVPAKLLDRRGRHTLWQVSSGAYLQVIDTTVPITANRLNLGRQVEGFMQSRAPSLYPTVNFAGHVGAPPTVRGSIAVSGSPGTVRDEVAKPDDGVFTGTIVANRRAVVLLKSTYHPRWHITVDGARVEPQMIAPSLVGAVVAPGRHRVEFRYAAYPRHLHLIALGLLALVALMVVPRMWTEWRRTRRRD